MEMAQMEKQGANVPLGIQGTTTVARPSEAEATEKARSLTIEVTAAAIAQIAKLAEKRKAEGKPVIGLRIGLRGGGCDGFSYLFEWADKPAGPKDRVFEFDAPATAPAGADKVRVFVDGKSILYLAGTTLNFVTGLMGHGFKFENPNVKGSCGCGESVQF